VLAPLLASLALFGGEPVCHGQIREPRPTSVVEQAIGYRGIFGFRRDRAYVRRVQRTGRSDETGVAFTPREWRYLRMRSRIENSGWGVDRYLRRHPDLSGGTSIEDDWPRGPYLLVRLTRDQALHEAELKRIYRYPENLRTALVPYSERYLRDVQDALDWDAAEADGFDIRGTSVDIDYHRVAVDLVTARTDHARYFAERYGPAVVTRVIATEPTYLSCAQTRGYRLSPGGRSLRLLYFSGGSGRFERVELTERGGRVDVGIVERRSHGFETADLRFESRVIRLRRPLGDRRVVDAGTGKAVRRVRCRRLSRCFVALERVRHRPPR
jgi:hypothetical protein